MSQDSTYHKFLTLLEVEVSHDKLIHTEVHSKAYSIQDLIFEQQSTYVGTL